VKDTHPDQVHAVVHESSSTRSAAVLDAIVRLRFQGHKIIIFMNGITNDGGIAPKIAALAD
jgi:hypothetical protein